MVERIARPRPKVTVAASSPTSTDDASKGYQYFSRWYNSTTGELFTCVDPAVGSAVWKEEATGSGGVHVDTVDPTNTDDASKGYQVGSLWLNTVKQELWASIDDTTDNAVWRDVTDLSHLDYLVGPVGHARFQQVQAAIDQAVADGATNLNPKDVWILPGTYTENLTLYAGVSLRSVIRRRQMFSGTPLSLGKFTASLVKIVGEHTFATDSAETYEQTITVDEVWISTTAGGTLFALSGTGKKRLWFHYCYLDADPGTAFTFSGGLCIVETDHCLVYSTNVIDVGSDRRLIAKQSLVWESSRGVAVRLHDGGWFIAYGPFGPGGLPGAVYGSVEVSAGTGSYLFLSGIVFNQASGDAIVVDGQLNAASWFSNITDTYANKATISGTYADQLKEYPFANAADVLRYDGSQWQPTHLPQNKLDATSAPTVNDDDTQGYSIGSHWVDVSADVFYICADASTGAAVWNLGVTSKETTSNKDMAASTTSSDGDLAVNQAIATTPAQGGYVTVEINGVHVSLGDGAKDKECYFSDDGGTTARGISSIVSGDMLYWMGSIAGFELAPADRVDFCYEVLA